MLDVSDITCIRQELTLFSRLSFHLNAGEALQILGENGVGKTSFLRIVAGLLTPETGRITWKNETAFSDQLLYLGHTPALKETLTVQENLQFNFQLFGLNPYKIPEIMHHLKLEPVKNQLISTLSAGQKRKTALAILWASEHPLWILDEPFTSLDHASAAQLADCLSQHVRKKGALIFTSHQPVALPSIEVKPQLLKGGEIT